MLTTYELRWFYPGKVPEEIQLWFEQDCLVQPLQPPETREDIYLYSPESEFLGIKLRQERLEVKWRKAELGVLNFGDSVEGKAEKWGKWLCCDSKQESFELEQVVNNPVWVSVQKVRYSQIYQVLPELLLQPVSDNENIDNGCRVELTHLVIQESNWWSIGFEAFGEDSRLMNNLQITANRAFNNESGSKFLADDSYAYPSWLAQVFGN
ncbi:hypothetical protein ACF3DV_08205 [Chlorogloeopsis fritschii PCC 9212]|uniref:CYTH domain-containing protein n=1 Tax=Chlorogloeopsis fritschii PCC 6912 TaxID=211165 RepID=A0A433N6H2_CHLFR|nr:hypothetical protein [Chlorogloeopsis fritschii]RUR77096.1 hypothetical protein PCC6912_40550 [Chlorogloeopsis fritschii PCC 6912]